MQSTNANKKRLYSWKTQNKQLRVNGEANRLALALLHSSCDDPSTAEDSSVPSHSPQVLTGTTPLAAMDCCSSVTHAPKRLGFFRLNDSLFCWRIWRRSFLITGYCYSRSLHLPFTVRMCSKVEWCQPISLQMTQWNQVSRWRNGTKLQMTQSEKRKTRTVSRPPTQVTLYHLKWASSALHDLWLEVWGSSCW